MALPLLLPPLLHLLLHGSRGGVALNELPDANHTIFYKMHVSFNVTCHGETYSEEYYDYDLIGGIHTYRSALKMKQKFSVNKLHYKAFISLKLHSHAAKLPYTIYYYTYYTVMKNTSGFEGFSSAINSNEKALFVATNPPQNVFFHSPFLANILKPRLWFYQQHQDAVRFEADIEHTPLADRRTIKPLCFIRFCHRCSTPPVCDD